MAGSSYQLPPPPPLDIHGPQVSKKWTRFKRAWTNYTLAMELSKKPQPVQVATLLTIIGEDAREVFSTFTGWETEGDENKLDPVIAKFEEYCRLQKNIPFERHCFNRRQQEAGETYEQYCTALRKLSQICEFHTITQEELLRDRLVFGIRDDKVRERLLRESNPTLAKTDEICRAAESMVAQMKVVGSGDTSNTAVSAITWTNNPKKETNVKPTRDCWNFGRRHQFHQRASCPAFGKICNKCGKPNHFAALCRSNMSGSHKSVQAIDDENGDEVFPTEISAVGVDDSQLVTVRLDSGNYLRFQVDTGAQCNVASLQLYQQATKDHKLAHVTIAKSRITAYGGTTLPVVGTVQLNVTQGSLNTTLNCKIVDGINIRPLLGKESGLQLKIISYLDNDKLNKLDTGNSLVFALDITTTLTREQLIKQYSEVFGPGVGLLEGKYCIRIDNTHQPVQHAPRRVPVAIRDKLKQTLEHLTQQGIITPITEPTDWISSMVAETKKTGCCEYVWIPKISTVQYNGSIIRSQPLRMWRLVCMEPSCLRCWM